MAITIVRQPTYPNVTGTNLVYTVTSTRTSEPQFQYVMDILQGSTIVTRVRQFPNPAGAGVFDIHRIVGDYLDIDEIWKTTSAVNGSNMGKEFAINFGEEWGTSSTSSVILYNGTTDAPGNPARAGNAITVFAGVVDPNNGSGYNFNTAPYYAIKPLSKYPFNNTGTYNADTAKPIAVTDYFTFSYLNNPADEVEEVIIKTYTATGSLLATSVLDVSTANVTGSIVHIPVGPKNMIDKGSTYASQFNANWAYYSVETAFEISSGTKFAGWFKREQECHYDRVRFAFVNSLGVWDYYGFNLPVSKTTNVTRSKVTRPFVDYSSADSTYDVNRRGHDYYNTSYEDRFIVTTNYIDQDTAKWLSDLMESPSVFVQEENNFLPIIITNTSYTHYTNTRGQKTFQYTIEYQYANTRLNR
jgi:hypothetical protein